MAKKTNNIGKLFVDWLVANNIECNGIEGLIASNVGVEDSDDNFTSSNLESVLKEIMTNITDMGERVSSLEAHHPSDIPQLDAPSIRLVSKTVDSLTFEWDEVDNAVKYGVSVNGGMTYTYTLDNTFVWRNLERNTSYTIYIKSIGNNFEYVSSVPSSLEATTNNIQGETLGTPVVTCTTRTNVRLVFEWEAIENALSYEISIDGVNYTNIGTNTTYTLRDLTDDTTYTFRVRAKGDGVYFYDSEVATCEVTTVASSSIQNISNTTSFNSTWKFNLLRLNGTENFSSNQGMLAKTYDDSSWSNVLVPHDWSISQDFSQTNTDYESGFLPGGDAIYRKSFNVDSDDLDKRYFISFDGVYMTSEVFVNGTSVGTNKYGYAPFEFDITDQIVQGTNVIAVTVSNRVPTSRYYSGSGIFRSVKLRAENSPIISKPDITITTPNLSTQYHSTVDTDCKIKVTNRTSSDKSVTVNVKVYQKWDDVEVGSTTLNGVVLSANTENTINVSVQVNAPELWETFDRRENTRLYYVEYSISYDTYEFMSDTETFGYRWLDYNSDGIYLNGTKLFLKGMSMHHDMGCYGAAMNKSAYYRQLMILKEQGINAIRCCHNPYAKEYFDMCAEYGFVSIEEIYDDWHSAKNTNTYDYARFFSQNDEYKKYPLESIIKRDKNNPSIIMWSLGNEVSEGATETRGVNYVSNCQKLHNWCKELDSTRATTYGENMPTNSYALQMMGIVDVIGVNYGDDSEYQIVRSTYPNKCMYGSETTSAFYTRNYYVTDNGTYKYTSYDYSNSESAGAHSGWGDSSCVALTRHRDTFPYLGGFFPWTGFDYIGEPTPMYGWPTRSSNFGMVDLCGFPKDAYYMYQAEYTTSPMIHICPMDWTNWTVGSDVSVWLYSNCTSVEFFVNGRSLGRKTTTDKTNHLAYEYTVPFEQGTIVANGYNAGGDVVAQDVLFTTGAVSAINLISDKTTVAKDGESVVFFECDMVDQYNNLCPKAENVVTFSCTGGTIIGTDNGFPGCIENLTHLTQTTFGGKCLVIVRPDYTSPNIVLTARSAAIEGSITISQGDSTSYFTKPQTEFVDATHPPIHIEVTNIVLSQYTVSIQNGSSANVSLTKVPAAAQDEVILTPSENITATYNADTNIITITPTQDDISGTVVVRCGSITKTINVAVGDMVAVEITIDMDGSNNIYQYEYLPITVTTTGGSYTISSSNSNILEVNEYGVAYGKSLGTANIIVTDAGGTSVEKQVTVEANPNASWKHLDSTYSNVDNVTITPNNPVQFNIGFMTSDSSVRNTTIIMEVPKDSYITSSSLVSAYGVSSDNTKDSYLLEATGSNTGLEARITFTDESAGRGEFIFRNHEGIIGKKEYKCGTKSCTSLTLNYSTYTIDGDENNNLLLIATPTPADTTDDVVWSVSNPICTYAGGSIVGTRNGSTVITATCGSRIATCNLTISNIHEDNTLIASDLYCDGSSRTTWYDGVWDSSYTMYAEFEVSETSSGAPNICSFGDNIGAWNGAHWHVYYPVSSNYGESGTGICIALSQSSSGGISTMYVTNTMLGDNNRTIRIAMNSNGIFINGSDATNKSRDYNAFNNLYYKITHSTIGSQEGSSHFMGVLKQLRVITLDDVKAGVDINATALESLSINGNLSDYIK